MSALNLIRLRELTLDAPSAAGRPAFLSAASGLVRVGEHLYVVADDELHLGAFTLDHAAAGQLMRLFPGQLPSQPKPRKAQKPDLEALTLLPPTAAYPRGALLALGSGSTANRLRGVLWALNRLGRLDGLPRVVDLAWLYDRLRKEIGELNIEGVVICNDQLKLLQRGNKTDARNFVLTMALSKFLHRVDDDAAEIPPVQVQPCRLGDIDGVPLTFTDGAALPDGGVLFTAVAEDTADSYRDGACVGAAIGILDAEGTVRRLELLPQPHKIEGVSVDVDNDVAHLLLVTDADDATISAQLFSAELRNWRAD